MTFKKKDYGIFITLQPSVTVTKRKITFASVIPGCKAVIIDEVVLNFETQVLYLNYSFFEVDSQIPKHNKCILST